MIDIEIMDAFYQGSVCVYHFVLVLLSTERSEYTNGHERDSIVVAIRGN